VAVVYCQLSHAFGRFLYRSGSRCSCGCTSGLLGLDWHFSISFDGVVEEESVKGVWHRISIPNRPHYHVVNVCVHRNSIQLTSLAFSRYVLAKTVTYRTCLRGFAGKLRALKAQSDSLFQSTGSYPAKLVFSRSASNISARTLATNHPWTLFTSDAAHTNLHGTLPPDLNTFLLTT